MSHEVRGEDFRVAIHPAEPSDPGRDRYEDKASGEGLEQGKGILKESRAEIRTLAKSFKTFWSDTHTNDAEPQD